VAEANSAADAWQNFATPHQIQRDQGGHGQTKGRASLDPRSRFLVEESVASL
jgi:hypothetical protein